VAASTATVLKTSAAVSEKATRWKDWTMDMMFYSGSSAADHRLPMPELLQAPCQFCILLN
jgi:hypothetical protein